MEALTTRRDAQMAEKAIKDGWDLSPEEWDEIKRCVFRLVRWKEGTPFAGRAWARGASLGIAMRGQNIKLKQMDQKSEVPAATQVHIHGDAAVSVTSDAILGVLALHRDLAARKTPVAEVIENAPPGTLSAQAPEASSSS